MSSYYLILNQHLYTQLSRLLNANGIELEEEVEYNDNKELVRIVNEIIKVCTHWRVTDRERLEVCAFLLGLNNQNILFPWNNDQISRFQLLFEAVITSNLQDKINEFTSLSYEFINQSNNLKNLYQFWKCIYKYMNNKFTDRELEVYCAIYTFKYWNRENQEYLENEIWDKIACYKKMEKTRELNINSFYWKMFFRKLHKHIWNPQMIEQCNVDVVFMENFIGCIYENKIPEVYSLLLDTSVNKEIGELLCDFIHAFMTDNSNKNKENNIIYLLFMEDYIEKKYTNTIMKESLDKAEQKIKKIKKEMYKDKGGSCNKLKDIHNKNNSVDAIKEKENNNKSSCLNKDNNISVIEFVEKV